MIRGISKKIIEINDTGSEFFEKAVLFLRCPDDYDEDKLRSEADKIMNVYFEKDCTFSYQPGKLRKHEEKKRSVLKTVGIVFGVTAVCFALCFILSAIF